MKELSIEEKAQRYDEALTKARNIVNSINVGLIGKDSFEAVFPELAESDDERIRKELIAEVKEQIDCIPAQDCRDKEDKKALKQLNKWLAWLKKQQKPADKVEPFDEYEGLTDFERTLADICIGWIGEELGWKQYIKDNADILLNIAIKKFNSVQDTSFEQKPAESKGMNLDEEEMTPFQKKVFCIIDTTIEEEHGLKQVCDELLRLAHDEIKQKPAWSEEDELLIRELESLVKQVWATAERENDKDTIHKMSNLSFFLKTLKPQPKQEWSEDDESKRKFIEDELSGLIADEQEIESPLTKRANDLYSALYWFESLRPQKQWKPSDEQMRVLDLAIRCGINRGTTEETTLVSLFNDLKKLRGE